jgi:hypothetical protein
MEKSHEPEEFLPWSVIKKKQLFIRKKRNR